MLLEFPPVQRRTEFDCLRTSMFVSHHLGSTRGELIPSPLLELASGDGRRVPLEESTPPGHILVRAKLDLWIIALGYLPHLFYGATLPTPPPPPAAPPVPPPPTAPPVPPAPGPSRVSPPPHPSHFQMKKEGRSCKRTPTEPRADWESGHPASSQAPPECPTIRIPPVRAPFVATRDPFRLPQQFPAEGFRPEGAVVHALYPLCKRCSNLNHLCTLKIGKRTLLAVGGGSSPTCTRRATRRRCPTFEWSSGNTWDWVPFTLCALTRALWIGWRLMRTDHFSSRSYSYREFLSNLRPTQHTAHAETRRKTARKASRRHGPTVIISSGSEDEGPAPKKRKTSRTGHGASAASSPEVIVVEDEEMPMAVDNMRNYDLDGDVPMPPVDPSITVDPNNYDVELQPAPPAIPLEQQVSSSRTTLDDPQPVATEPAQHFLGFRLRPIEEFSAAARPTFVDEIVQWAIEGEEDEMRVESALLFMLAIFSQAGNTLGQQHQSGKGKAHEQ
ncbi:hypothetical protein K438DRAFT_1781909 [Mycena galopus ATCC 62051]|nr:hypothetical protein K438DRAFT_1781909 [Mycena galopus ATCC 62051]